MPCNRQPPPRVAGKLAVPVLIALVKYWHESSCLTPSPRYAEERGGERGQKRSTANSATCRSTSLAPLPGLPGRGSLVFSYPCTAFKNTSSSVLLCGRKY